MEKLPYFKYHPAPTETGAIKPSEETCVCCGQARGYAYFGPVYAEGERIEPLCPWCIADGAASKLGASFADTYLLTEAGIPEEIAEEINLRTPGFSSWQGEQWLSHCNDACEFHGDASVEDVLNASQETKQQWLQDYQLEEKDWQWATKGYQPAGDSAFYKFVCRHCRLVMFGWDMS